MVHHLFVWVFVCLFVCLYIFLNSEYKPEFIYIFSWFIKSSYFVESLNSFYATFEIDLKMQQKLYFYIAQQNFRFNIIFAKIYFDMNTE